MNKLSYIFVAALFFLSIHSAWAHREDYLNKTFVYQTIEPTELELEYWSKYGSESTSPVHLVAWEHTGAVELGINDHWMIESNSTFRHSPDHHFDHLITRVESRFRLFEEGAKFLDPAFSVEYSISNVNQKTEHIIEPTFVLSKDFSRLNFTLNISTAKILNSSEGPDVGYAFASRYDFRRFLRVGFEAQGELGHDAPQYFIPQIHLLLPHEITPKFGVGVRYSGEGEKIFLKFVIETGLEFEKSKMPKGK